MLKDSLDINKTMVFGNLLEDKRTLPGLSAYNFAALEG